MRIPHNAEMAEAIRRSRAAGRMTEELGEHCLALARGECGRQWAARFSAAVLEEAQGAFLQRMVRDWPRLREDGSPAGYARRMFRSAVRDEIRSSERREGRERTAVQLYGERGVARLNVGRLLRRGVNGGGKVTCGGGELKRVLVLGCGRCGTTYTAAVLRALGLDVGHEREGRDGRVDWKAVGWRGSTLRSVPQYRHTLQVVREPLAAIRSMTTIKPRSWRYIAGRSAVDAEESLLLRCMAYYVHWNGLASIRAETVFRVEELWRERVRLCEVLDVHCPPLAVEPSRRTNTRRHLPGQAARDAITWETLEAAGAAMCEAVMETARGYGYTI